MMSARKSVKNDNVSSLFEDSQRFAALFRGNKRSYGVWSVNNRMATTKNEVQLSNYESHLNGKVGVGIVPILDDGTLWFAAIDIDCHGDAPDIDLASLSNKVRAQDLPLVVCRSKSGGAHCYLFGSEPLPAGMVRTLMAKWASALGYSGAEIFPKQASLRGDALGNWINLPYFNAENSVRYAVDSGKPVNLDYFLSLAEGKAVSQKQLEKFQINDYPEAPPCVQKMVMGGVTKNRNEALYAAVVYLKRAFPDDYRDKAFDLNNIMFQHPLTHSEATKTVKSASRREYSYRCSEEPCRSLCDRDVCLTRKYGISPEEAADLENGTGGIEFGELKKIDTEPPKWQLRVNGKDIIVTTDILMHYAKLRQVLLETLHVLVPLIKPKDWERQLAELLEKIEVETAPEDASSTGLVETKLREFLKRADLTKTGTDKNDRENLKRGMPIVQIKDGRRVIYFRGPDFIDFLKRARSEFLSSNNLWIALRHIGCGHERLRLKNDDVVLVWWMPIDDNMSNFEDELPNNLGPEY